MIINQNNPRLNTVSKGERYVMMEENWNLKMRQRNDLHDEDTKSSVEVSIESDL